MKDPIDDLNIIVRHDGLVLVKHPRWAMLGQLLTPGMVEVILRALEAERCAEKAPHGKVGRC